MRHLPLVALSLIALAGAAPTLADAPRPATDTVATPAPVLRFSPATIEFGEMHVGQPETATLTVTNTGPAAVTVEAIKAGCGCTKVTDPPKDPVAPGASFTVQVTLDPGKRGGVDLVRSVNMILAGGTVESLQIKGRVKAVVTVSPETVEVRGEVDRPATISIERVDGGEFAVTGAVPEGIVSLPKNVEVAKRFELSIDLAAWARAGRPSTILVNTDRPDAPEVHVPIRGAEKVALFRLPAEATGESADVASRQDRLIQGIDAGLARADRSAEFSMRLHRESGMLFVHGTESDLDAVRAAVQALPPDSGVRESVPAGTS